MTRIRGTKAVRLLGALLLLSLVGAAQGAPGPGGEDPAEKAARSRHLKTVGLSLLLPGLGHLAEGRSSRAVPFLLAEAGFWGGFAVYRVRGGLRRDSYLEIAQMQAGVARPKGQDDDYYRLIGIWPSSDAYNETIRRAARLAYPDDLAGRAAYFEAHQVPADRTWSWESQTALDRYLKKRQDSQQAYRRARTMVALAVANRIAAILDFALFSRSPDPGGSAIHLELTPGAEPASARLALRCDLR